MSDSIAFNPARFLSSGLRERIEECGVSLNDYASTICDRLRLRGEYELAAEVNEEIRRADERMAVSAARNRADKEWRDQQDPPTVDLCDNGEKHRWQRTGVSFWRCLGCGRERFIKKD